MVIKLVLVIVFVESSKTRLCKVNQRHYYKVYILVANIMRALICYFQGMFLPYDTPKTKQEAI